MEPKLLLLHAIAVIIIEREYQRNASEESLLVLKRTISTIQGNLKRFRNLKDPALNSLLTTCEWVYDIVSKKEKIPSKHIISRLYSDVDIDTSCIRIIETIEMVEQFTEVEQREYVERLRKDVFRQLHGASAMAAVERTYHQLKNGVSGTSIEDVLNELRDSIANTGTIENALEGISIDEGNSDQEGTLAAILVRAYKDLLGESGVKPGWQDIQDFIGEGGTLRFGMMVGVLGVQHGFKSGFCRDLFSHFVMYNDPPEFEDKTKRAGAIFISAENRAEEDLMSFYLNVVSNETGVKPNLKKMQFDEMNEVLSEWKEKGKCIAEEGQSVESALEEFKLRHLDDETIGNMSLEEVVTIDQVMEEAQLRVAKDMEDTLKFYFSRRGWYWEIVRVDPNITRASTLFDKIRELEGKGILVRIMVMDYLALINKDDYQTSMTGEDTRRLFQSVRTFMTVKNILFITPHQLSQDAINLKRMDVENFVKQLPGKNYYDGSRRIPNELDLEFFVDLVTFNGKTYLAVQRGKFRSPIVVEESKRFVFLPMGADSEGRPLGSCPPDIGKQRVGVRKLVASTGVDDSGFDF